MINIVPSPLSQKLFYKINTSIRYIAASNERQQSRPNNYNSVINNLLL